MSIFNRIKSLFLHGFFALLPLLITIGIIRLLFRVLKSLLEPIYAIEPAWLQQIPHGEILLSILAIFILGILYDLVLKYPIMSIEQLLINRVPLLRQVYFSSKKLIEAFNPRKKQVSFKKVVLVEFPRAGVWSLAFVTNELVPDLAPNKSVQYYNVFVPHVPNPAVGYFMMVPATDCKSVNITRQEALALIVSGGIIKPEQFSQQSGVV